MMRKSTVIFVMLSVMVVGCSSPASPADEARQQGDSLKARGNYAGAIIKYTEAIRLNPDDVAAHWRRYEVLRALSKFEELDEDLNAVIRIDPNHVEARYARGFFMGTDGEYDKAIEDFTVVIELPTTDDSAYFQQASHYERGRVLNDVGRYDEAIGDFDAVIRLDPTHANAYSNRGDSWMNKHEYDKAIADYEQSLRIDPTGSYTEYKKGLALDAKRSQNR